MGLLSRLWWAYVRCISRIGCPGGTARWAAKCYGFIRRLRPERPEELPDKDVFRLMVWNRYKILPNAKKEMYLTSRCDDVLGLVGLVIEILKVEASLHENDGGVIYEIIVIVDDVLQKRGIPEATRWGTTSWEMAKHRYIAEACRPPKYDEPT